MELSGIGRRSGVGARLRAVDWRLQAERGGAFATALALGRVRLFGSFAPFGVAFAAVAPPGLAGALVTLGAAAGYLSVWEPLGALKYLAALVLTRAALRILRELKRGKSLLAPLGVASLALAAVGFVYAFDRAVNILTVTLYLAESFTAGAFAYFYGVALSPWRESADGTFGRLSHTVSLLLLSASALAGLVEPMLFGVLSPGRVGALLIVLLAVRKGGLGTGAAVGASLGAGMDLASGTPGVFTLAYTLSAVLSGIFRTNARLLWLLSFTAAEAIATVWTWPLRPEAHSLYECFAASVIFFLVPDRVLARVGAVFPMRATGYGFLRAREYTRKRLELAGEGLGILAGLVEEPQQEPHRETAAQLFDRAAAEVCTSCPQKGRCWRTDTGRTVAAFDRLAPLLAREGRVEARELEETCERAPWLAAALNGQARLQRLRQEESSRLREAGNAAVGQYRDVEALLSTMKGWLDGGVTVDTGREKRLTKYLASLGVDASVAVFRIRGRRMRVELRGEELEPLTGAERWLERLSREAGLRLKPAEQEEGRLVLTEAAPLSLTFAAAGAARELGTVSGDTVIWCVTDEGLGYGLISDGMGSGPEAQAISSALASSLGSFLAAGLAPDLALRLAEHMLAVKNERGLASATVDLLAADTFTGQATLHKLGAAPSYLRREGTVRRLHTPRLPAGFLREGGSPLRLRLAEGDRLVLVSDGVNSGDDTWVRNLIQTPQEPQALADALLAEAIRRTGAADDMTVLVVEIRGE